MKATCAQCGGAIDRIPSRLTYDNQFCNKSCHARFKNKRRFSSEEKMPYWWPQAKAYGWQYQGKGWYVTPMGKKVTEDIAAEMF